VKLAVAFAAVKAERTLKLFLHFPYHVGLGGLGLGFPSLTHCPHANNAFKHRRPSSPDPGFVPRLGQVCRVDPHFQPFSTMSSSSASGGKSAGCHGTSQAFQVLISVVKVPPFLHAMSFSFASH